MTNPACPFCYRRIDPRHMTFKCVDRDEKDVECGEMFIGDGTQRAASCPKGGHQATKIRFCAACQTRLPPLFGRTDSRLVAMMGATFSGKTVYLTTLVREWNGRVGAGFGSTMMPVNDLTTKRYQELKGALDSRGVIPGTDKVEPYVFTIDIPGERLVQKLTCSFLDSPGERQARLEDLERYSRYISSADGIILLLDPVTMPGAEGYVESGQKADRWADNQAVVQMLVRYMLDNSGTQAEPVAAEVAPRRRFFGRRREEEKGEERMPVPIAVVLAKMDAVQSGIGELSDHLGVAHHDGYYDDSRAPQVDALVRDLMRRWDGHEIEAQLTANFANVRFFAASSLGHPTEDGRVSRRGWHPQRVEDPLLWLLSEFDVIRTRPDRP